MYFFQNCETNEPIRINEWVGNRVVKSFELSELMKFLHFTSSFSHSLFVCKALSYTHSVLNCTAYKQKKRAAF